MPPNQRAEQSILPDGDIGDEVLSSFATLGLAPTAGADLVDLAYHHQVAIACDQRTNEEGIAALDRARRLLHGMVAPVTPLRPPPPAPDERSQLGPPRSSSRGWWFVRKGRSNASRQPEHGLTPYHMLRVDPAVDPALLAQVYRHLLRAAARADDAIALEGFERAYALVGTPEARAISDRHRSLLDAWYAAPSGAANGTIVRRTRTSRPGMQTGTAAEADDVVSAPVAGYA